MISKLPIQSEIGPLLQSYLDLLEALEITEVVGRDVLEEGLKDLAVGALALGARQT